MLSTKMQVFCQKRKWLVFRSQFGPLFLIRHATNNFLFTHTHNHAHNVSRMALMRFWLAKCELKLFRGSGVRGSCSCVDALGNQRQQQVCVYGPFNCSENSNGARLKGLRRKGAGRGWTGQWTSDKDLARNDPQMTKCSGSQRALSSFLAEVWNEQDKPPKK